MSVSEKDKAVYRAQDEATEAKRILLHIMRDLINEGAVRKANALGTIIGRLENWQNS